MTIKGEELYGVVYRPLVCLGRSRLREGGRMDRHEPDACGGENEM